MEPAVRRGERRGAASRHFDDVERLDLPGTVTFADIEAVRSYFGSSDRLAPALEQLPTSLTEPLVARRSRSVFVATKRGG